MKDIWKIPTFYTIIEKMFCKSLRVNMNQAEYNSNWIVFQSKALREKSPSTEFFLPRPFPVFGLEKFPYLDTFHIIRTLF